MFLERVRRFPFKESSPRPPPVRISRQEFSRLESILFNIYGPQITVTKRPEGNRFLIQPQVRIGEDGEVVLVERINSPQPTIEEPTNNLLFNLVFRELPKNEQRELMNYMEAEGEIVYLRRTQPSEEFTQALIDFSEKHLGGFSPLIVTSLAPSTLIPQIVEGGDSDEQKQEIGKLQKLSQKKTPVHFAVISRPPSCKSKTGWRDLQQILWDINNRSDRYEFVYDLFLTTNELEEAQTALAGGFLGLGLFALGVLPPLENKLAMIGSQLAGEGLVLTVNQLDRVAHFLPSGFKNFLGKLGIILARTQSVNELTQLEKTFNRVGRVLSTVSLLTVFLIARELTQLTIETQNLLYFLSIAPLNSTLLFFNEILNRTLKAYAFLKQQDVEVKKSLVEVLSLEKPTLAKLLNSYPSLAIALIDFITNKPAVFAWLSTFAGFASLTAINHYHRLPMNVNEAFSGLIFEGVGGGLGVFLGKIKDPWQAFQEFLPALAKMNDLN